MKFYRSVSSSVKPEAFSTDEKSVYIAANITESELDDESGITVLYTYDLTKYDKDEYILLQGEQITELQMALIELQ